MNFKKITLALLLFPVFAGCGNPGLKQPNMEKETVIPSTADTITLGGRLFLVHRSRLPATERGTVGYPRLFRRNHQKSNLQGGLYGSDRPCRSNPDHLRQCENKLSRTPGSILDCS